MRVHQVVYEADPLDAIKGKPAVFLSKSGKQVTGTITGPSMKGTPGEVAFKPNKGQPFNVKADKLLDPNTRAPLKGASAVSAQATGAKAPSATNTDAKAPPSNDTKTKKSIKDKLLKFVSKAKDGYPNMTKSIWSKRAGIKGFNWAASLIQLLNLWPATSEYIHTYILNDRDPTNNEVIRKAQAWDASFTAAVVGAASGAAAGVFTKIYKFIRLPMLAIPGFGWLGFAASTAVVYFIQKALSSTDFVEKWITKPLIKPLSAYALPEIAEAYIEKYFDGNPDEMTIFGFSSKKTTHESADVNLIEQGATPPPKEGVAVAKDIFKDAPPEIKAAAKDALVKAKQKKKAKQAAS